MRNPWQPLLNLLNKLLLEGTSLKRDNVHTDTQDAGPIQCRDHRRKDT